MNVSFIVFASWDTTMVVFTHLVNVFHHIVQIIFVDVCFAYIGAKESPSNLAPHIMCLSRIFLLRLQNGVWGTPKMRINYRENAKQSIRWIYKTISKSSTPIKAIKLYITEAILWQRQRSIIKFLIQLMSPNWVSISTSTLTGGPSCRITTWSSFFCLRFLDAISLECSTFIDSSLNVWIGSHLVPSSLWGHFWNPKIHISVWISKFLSITPLRFKNFRCYFGNKEKVYLLTRNCFKSIQNLVSFSFFLYFALSPA